MMKYVFIFIFLGLGLSTSAYAQEQPLDEVITTGQEQPHDPPPSVPFWLLDALQQSQAQSGGVWGLDEKCGTEAECEVDYADEDNYGDCYDENGNEAPCDSVVADSVVATPAPCDNPNSSPALIRASTLGLYFNVYIPYTWDGFGVYASYLGHIAAGAGGIAYVIRPSAEVAGPIAATAGIGDIVYFAVGNAGAAIDHAICVTPPYWTGGGF